MADRWSEKKYREFLDEKRKELMERDGCLDNVGQFAEDLLMYTPGLGPYLRKKMQELFPMLRLANDLKG